ncbi:MAG: CapA family protein [Actinomycetaceae bacterium]|nr:CapA family protein [Actinomycetaceae bacterium]MDY6083102.1 CapA family protein [Actinomycetaceae bacterium]
MKRNALRLIPLLMVASVALSACHSASQARPSTPTPTAASSSVSQESPSAQPTAAESTPEEPDITLTVAATGDILPHKRLMPDTRTKGKTQISHLLSAIKPYIAGADLALCHQEAAVAFDGVDFEGFPEFQMPQQWISDIKDLGYDGCSTASNHTYDHAFEGLTHTLTTLTSHGLGTAGSQSTEKQLPYQMYDVTKDGRTIKIAHLSLTYGLNQQYARGTSAAKVLGSRPWSVNADNVDQTIEWAKQARQAGADIVIVSAHQGREYHTEPSEGQIEWGKRFAQSGVVDLYIGHHPHVPGAITKIPGGVDGDGMWAYYSTGNLLASMQPKNTTATQAEEIALATITVPAHGVPHVSQAGWVALTADLKTHRVVPISEALSSQASGLGESTQAVQKQYALLHQAVGDEAVELTTPPHQDDAVKVVPEPRI